MPDMQLPGEIAAALTKLEDAICSYNRTSGREYTLLLVPHACDEPACASVDGKPVLDQPLERLLELALEERWE